MRQLKGLYPEYAEQVDFYEVGISPSFDTLERLENDRVRNGYPWPIANPVNDRQALSDLNISYQSVKIAFDSKGVITYRDGFGGGGKDVWKQVFDGLANQ